MRLPHTSLHLIHIDRSYLSGHSQIFTVGRVVQTSGYLSLLKLVVQDVQGIVFLLEIPLVYDTVLATYSDCVEVRSDCSGYDGGHY